MALGPLSFEAAPAFPSVLTGPPAELMCTPFPRVSILSHSGGRGRLSFLSFPPWFSPDVLGTLLRVFLLHWPKRGEGNQPPKFSSYDSSSLRTSPLLPHVLMCLDPPWPGRYLGSGCRRGSLTPPRSQENWGLPASGCGLQRQEGGKDSAGARREEGGRER